MVKRAEENRNQIGRRIKTNFYVRSAGYNTGDKKS
jgi:hypothetical protein